MKKLIALMVFAIITFSGFSQEEESVQEVSNIQEYTPSKLLKKGNGILNFLTVCTPKQNVQMLVVVQLIFQGNHFLPTPQRCILG